MKKKFLIFIIGLLLGSKSNAIEPKVLEAAFIFNFIKFTDFSHIQGDLQLCVDQDQEIETILREKVEGKLIQNHQLKVFSLSPNQTCHIILSDVAERNEKQLLISRTFNKNAIIILERKTNKVTFKVNLKALQTSQLEISPKVLRLAKEVIK